MGTVIFTIVLVVFLRMRPVDSVHGFPFIKKNPDDTVQPCVDFYNFVCDQWAKQAVPKGVSNWTELNKRSTLAKQRIAEHLHREVKNEDIHPVKWAKIHFQACMNDNASNESGVRSLVSIVNYVSDFGWNILGGSPENDWVTVHNNYCRLTGEGALFTVKVGPDEDFKRNVIIINPTEELFLPHISRLKPKDIPQYVQFVADIWTAYAKDRGYPIYPLNAVKNAIRDVVSFRQAIIEKRQLIERTSTMRAMMLSDLQEHTWNNMKKKDLYWPQILRSIFHIEFNESTVVHIRQFNYVKIILRAIGSTSVEILLNHIHLHFLEKFIQHTSSHMNTLLYRVLNRPVPERSMTCITSNAMKRIVNYIYVHKHITKSDILIATKIVRKVREILKRQISETTWMIKEAAGSMRKLDKMTMIIGYDSWYAKEKNVIDYYSRMRISDNYMRNILDFETVSYRDELRRLGMRVTEEFDEHLTDPFGVSATYNYQTNTMVVPAALFDFPIMEKPFALKFYYGGLGTIVGSALSRSLDSLGGQYDEKGNQGNWWRNDTLNAYKERLRCYSKRFKEVILRAKLNFTQVDRNDYSDDIVADYMGLVAAFESYKRKLGTSNTSANIIYKVYQGSEFQEFFVIYAMRHCEAFAAPVRAEMAADGRLPQELRVNTALSNMQAFADTFRCKENDPMNSSPKCEWLDESCIRNTK